MTRCPKCGKANEADSDFCEECGASLNAKIKKQQKNVTLATFLPLLIGAFAYLYFPNYKKFFAYLIAVIIAALISGGWLAYLFTPWFMYDCRAEAKKINGEG